jgi:Flp pilus assembly protein TadD
VRLWCCIEATDLLRLAVDLDREHCDALTNLAAVLNRMGRSVEATEVIGRERAARPGVRSGTAAADRLCFG